MAQSKQPRPRRSRQFRSKRRRDIIRVLRRRGEVGPLSYVYRGQTRWLHCDDLDKLRAVQEDL